MNQLKIDFPSPQCPEISYSHVLAELSVNRKDPCEVIRELISNSYDAKASLIEIYPILQTKGFIYFDNGMGLDQHNQVNGITPYKAFFSIGKSTKTKGESIGYKCQGSKLCFASKRITVITKCKNEKKWRYISVDNPKNNLDQQFDISPKITDEPWEVIKNLFKNPDKNTKQIIQQISQFFFEVKFKNKGTMIIVDDLEIENFKDFFDSEENPSAKLFSYLKHYIRFNTRHGDMRILSSEKTGFPTNKESLFKKTNGYNDQCELYLWSLSKKRGKQKAELEKIEPGFPYLEQPNEADKIKAKNPSQVSSLSNGSFFDRAAKTFDLGGYTYCITLAIDGNRRALNQYEELDRKGKKRSGIRLTDQRGTFISSDGVRICQYNQLFEHSKLSEYSLLKSGNAQSHYILIINGTFNVVTNRNALTDESLQLLKSDELVEQIRIFLDDFCRKSEIFRELIERLNKINQEAKLEDYNKRFNILKKGIQDRLRFQVKSINEIKDTWIIAPETGEEHWVGALYSMFAHFVPQNSSYKSLWLRPRTFSGIGLDSIAVEIDENSLLDKVHKGLEYKYSFSAEEPYNHPLILTDQIVCWEIDNPINKIQIKDDYNYFGEVFLSNELNNIGYEIININSKSGETHHGKIKVISLKNLLDKTFICNWINPPK